MNSKFFLTKLGLGYVNKNIVVGRLSYKQCSNSINDICITGKKSMIQRERGVLMLLSLGDMVLNRSGIGGSQQLKLRPYKCVVFRMLGHRWLL